MLCNTDMLSEVKKKDKGKAKIISRLLLLEILHKNQYYKAKSKEKKIGKFQSKAENCNDNMLIGDIFPGQFSCSRCSYLRLPFPKGILNYLSFIYYCSGYIK